MAEVPVDAAAKQTSTHPKLKDAVLYFTSETSSTKTKGNVKLQSFLEAIETKAQKDGLAPEVITSLAKCAANARFSENVCIRLIKALIPARSVQEEAIVHVISWMCTNKPSTTIQMWLVRWIILVYEYIDQKDKLHALYGILFLFIDNEKMCPYLCHLLYLMTRKEDVKHFRIRKLIQFQARAGPQTHILGLLSVYKLYCPNLVTVSTSVGNKPFFRQTDRKWSETIRRVVEKGLQDSDRIEEVGVVREAELQATSGQKAKRRKMEVVPKVHMSTLSRGRPGNLKVLQFTIDKVPVEQIQTFQQLLKNFHRLELPSQIASLLRSPHLQQVLSCMSEQTVLQRLSNWLHMTLYTEIIDYPMEGNSPRAEYLLQLLIDFTDFLQESIPVCELFLTKYLYTWNGSDYRPYILQLITRFRIWPFEKMNDLLLEPLRKLFFCSSVYFKCQVLYSFTTLLRNFVSIEWPRYKGRPDGDGVNIAGSALDINEIFAFGEPLGEFSAMNTITEFIGFVDSLCALGLQVEGSNSLLLHHSLAFYELVSKIHTVYNFPYVCLPSEGIALRAMYSSDAMVLSRICQLLCNYKKEIDHLKTLQDDEHATASMAIIPQMNSYILHLCNLLWRGKAFHADSLLSVTAKDVPQLDLSDYNSIFSIWEHPALQWCASLYDIESGGAPQDKNTAKEYLNYLQSLQLGGIDIFLTTYIQRYAKKSP